MMSMADLAAIMRIAAERGCRVLITGDHEQLAAVEGGGGMVMLTRQMGYVQLAEPVRFGCEWERDATLRLRAGDAEVLSVYAEQGRLRGGDPEQAMDLACRAYVADHLAGKDALAAGPHRRASPGTVPACPRRPAALRPRPRPATRSRCGTARWPAAAT